LVSRWNHLHRRDVQERRKADFAKGASLKAPSELFNSSLEGNTRRAIDLHEADEIDEDAFKTPTRRCSSEQVKDSIAESGAS